jgi:hypothetical protein
MPHFGPGSCENIAQGVCTGQQRPSAQKNVFFVSFVLRVELKTFCDDFVAGQLPVQADHVRAGVCSMHQ